MSNKINRTYKMGTAKQINIKNRTYYFDNDIINLENFDSSLLKLDEKNHIKTLVFTILDILQLKKLVIVKYLQCESSIFTYYSRKRIYRRNGGQ